MRPARSSAPAPLQWRLWRGGRRPHRGWTCPRGVVVAGGAAEHQKGGSQKDQGAKRNIKGGAEEQQLMGRKAGVERGQGRVEVMMRP